MVKTGSNHLKLSKTLRISMLFTCFQPFSAGSTGSTGSMNYAPATHQQLTINFEKVKPPIDNLKNFSESRRFLPTKKNKLQIFLKKKIRLFTNKKNYFFPGIKNDQFKFLFTNKKKQSVF